MGFGDEVMVTAQARRLQALDARPVAVRAKDRVNARWHAIWDRNPRLVRPEDVAKHDVQWLENYSGRRPYIEYGRTTREQWCWRADEPREPGEIYLSTAERAEYQYLRDYVLIEPNLKPGAPPTKQWGEGNWQQLVRSRRNVEWLQIGTLPNRVLSGVRFVETRNVREAAAVLANVRSAVLPEGGLHHAAAALNTPSVVIFGGYIGPAVTGYPGQRSLFVQTDQYPIGCGWRRTCEHCTAAMASITVDQVGAELDDLLRKAE